MEAQQPPEKISHISLDSFLEFIASQQYFDGKLIEDETHAFYIWVTKMYPEFQDIDGVSLVQLYEKNVVEGEMDRELFYQYCKDHNFPTPYVNREEDEKHHPYFNNFVHFFDEVMEDKKSEYEEWAKENGIDTSHGAVTIFLDIEGNRYKVRTDFDNYGTLIQE